MQLHQCWMHSVSERSEKIPALFLEIIEATDLETTLLIARERGGRRELISQNPQPDNWLVKLVGLEKAKIIGRVIAASTSVQIDIPMGKNWLISRGIEAAIASGLSNSKIAAKIGVHRKTVQRHRKRIREGGRTPCAEFSP